MTQTRKHILASAAALITLTTASLAPLAQAQSPKPQGASSSPMAGMSSMPAGGMEGAIEMAQMELKDGKEPQMKKMARAGRLRLQPLDRFRAGAAGPGGAQRGVPRW